MIESRAIDVKRRGMEQTPAPGETRVIVAIRSGRGRSSGCTIELDDGSAIPLPDTLAFGFATGDRLDAATVERLRGESERWRVRDAALGLLSYRARSRHELEDRLRRKGFDPVLVSTTADALESDGYLDDASFAMAFARERIRSRPRGARRIRSELRRRGVREGTADAAIERAMDQEETDEATLALEAARAWLRRASADDRDALCGGAERAARQRASRRFYGYMSRRGFGSREISQARGRLCE